MNRVLDEVARWMIAGAIVAGLIFGVPAFVEFVLGGAR